MEGQLDIALLLDSSGSIGFKKFQKLKGFLKDFFSQAPLDPDNIRLAALSYSRVSRIEFYFNDFLTNPNYKDKIIKEIGRIRYMSSLTNTTGALQVAKDILFKAEYGKRMEVPGMIIFFSDGNTNVVSTQYLGSKLTVSSMLRSHVKLFM